MTWNHYHSKPSTCKAIEWDNKKETFEFLKTIKPEITIQFVDCLRIPTREGTMIAYLGDFIVEDSIKGLYPCNAQVFHKRWITTKKINRKRPSSIRPHKMKNMTEDVVKLIAWFNEIKEERHYTELAELLFQIKRSSNMSERDLVNHIDLSKSEVHRMIVIGGMARPLLEAAKKFNVEKYVLLELEELPNFHPKKPSMIESKRELISHMIINGTLTTRSQLHKFTSSHFNK